ncbi:MAG: HNH endonuclease [Candidatus Adiutrix sp.]|jgi:site-specific DNA-methyltransferase (adenine-specific)|nr:HNH endonuclease [Candidatus Adiutrix sp.]
MLAKSNFKNTLYINDNLDILLGLNSELVDLIYLDPPFNSKRMYSAPVGSRAAGASFKDMWTWKDVDEYRLDSLAVKCPELTKYISSVAVSHSKSMMAYLTYMAQRIIEMHRVLKNTGTFYLHCNPTAGHYLKIILDFIFDKNNFRNEIVWCYRGGGVPRNDFAKKHDIILRYSKSNKYTFNLDEVRIPYSSDVLDSNPSRYDKSYRSSGVYDGYRPNPSGKHPEDWWPVQPLMPSDKKERTGYPTQKPLVLLKRIIKASSNEGDLVMDPFCGCATTCVGAERLGRKWIGIDIESKTNDILIQRLNLAKGILFDAFISTDKAPVRTDLKEVRPSEPVKTKLYKEQRGLCNACGNQFEARNLEIDHIVPKSKGGGDYYENYQLLCGSCNRIKGDRPMEYLRLKIATREKQKGKIFFGD